MGNAQGAEDRGEEIQDCRQNCNTACWRGHRYGSAILSHISIFGVMLLCVVPLSNVQLGTGDDKTVSKEELGKGRQQVSDSRSRLLKLKTERDLDVSAVRVTGDERESQRRSKEEEERQVTTSMQHLRLTFLT